MSSLSLRFFSLLEPVMQDNFTVKRYKKNMKIFTFLFTFSVLSIDFHFKKRFKRHEPLHRRQRVRVMQLTLVYSCTLIQHIKLSFNLSTVLVYRASESPPKSGTIITCKCI